MHRFKTPLTLAMVDLDDFKHVNDTYGHEVGDQALKHVTQVMQGVLRAVDAIGRVGGEEFCLILPETDSVAANTVSNRLVTAIGAQGLRAGEAIINLTVSCGFVSYTNEGDLEELLRKADQALYAAKAAGKNQAVIYGADGFSWSR